ncbi:MAG: flagellar basal body L-ring protein FlgH [Bdellovibrionia bacterium]
MNKLLTLVLMAVLSFAVVGCGSFGKKLKAFMAGDDAPVVQNQGAARFSTTAAVPVDQKRRLYKRTTRESFEREGMLEDNSGSLWVMEGQGSYLFSNNIIRVVGDLVNVELDGGPRSQLTAKVDVIKKLIEKSRRDTRREIAMAAAAAAALAGKADVKTESVSPNGQPTLPGDKDGKDDDNKDDPNAPGFDVSLVPARIVEKSQDGSYRIKGSQQFMIGQKEYKVIVTGMVRSSDISDDTIQASRVLDPRFDIVSTKKETR